MTAHLTFETVRFRFCCFWFYFGRVEQTNKSPRPLTVAPFRNCGNVFCASCCDHKATSQQLYEPNRVCQACYGHLRPSAVPPVLPPADLELEKPITASSNWTEPFTRWPLTPVGILTKSASREKIRLVQLPTANRTEVSVPKTKARNNYHNLLLNVRSGRLSPRGF